MKQLKILNLLLILILISSCGVISEGFKSPKQNNSDEFLIEKKSPLVMPPEFDELPIPDDKVKNNTTNEKIALDGQMRPVRRQKKNSRTK